MSTSAFTATGITKAGTSVVSFVETETGGRLYSSGLTDLSIAELRHVATVATYLATNAEIRAKAADEGQG